MLQLLPRPDFPFINTVESIAAFHADFIRLMPASVSFPYPDMFLSTVEAITAIQTVFSRLKLLYALPLYDRRALRIVVIEVTLPYHKSSLVK